MGSLRTGRELTNIGVSIELSRLTVPSMKIDRKTKLAVRRSVLYSVMEGETKRYAAG